MDIVEAYNFLMDHPAFPDSRIDGKSLELYIVHVCKRGYSFVDPIWEGEKRMHYEEAFGEKWERDHAEYRVHVFPCRWCPDRNRWESYVELDLCEKGRSYDEAIIKMAQSVKKNYGDFSNSSIVPEEHRCDIVAFDMNLLFERLENPNKYPNVIHQNEFWWKWYQKDEYKPRNGIERFL